MKNRKPLSRHLFPAVVFCAGLVSGMLPALFHGPGAPGSASAASAPGVTELHRSALETAPGVEVIVSLVELPPATQLPAHYHPGEEFVYVLEGQATTRLDSGEEVTVSAGEVSKIPYRVVHSAATGEQPARAVVFRVHESGQPERIPANAGD